MCCETSLKLCLFYDRNLLKIRRQSNNSVVNGFHPFALVRIDAKCVQLAVSVDSISTVKREMRGLNVKTTPWNWSVLFGIYCTTRSAHKHIFQCLLRICQSFGVRCCDFNIQCTHIYMPREKRQRQIQIKLSLCLYRLENGGREVCIIWIYQRQWHQHANILSISIQFQRNTKIVNNFLWGKRHNTEERHNDSKKRAEKRPNTIKGKQNMLKNTQNERWDARLLTQTHRKNWNTLPMLLEVKFDENCAQTA